MKERNRGPVVFIVDKVYNWFMPCIPYYVPRGVAAPVHRISNDMIAETVKAQLEEVFR